MQNPASGAECHKVIQDGDRLAITHLCGRGPGRKEVECESAVRPCCNVHFILPCINQ